MKAKSKILLVLSTLAILISGQRQAQALTFKAISFPANFTPFAINDQKLVYGSCAVGTQSVPCYYHLGTNQITPVPLPAGVNFSGGRMNNLGTVVGSGTHPAFSGFQALYLGAGGFTPIAATGTGIFAANVSAINNFDVMAGMLLNGNPCPACLSGSFVFHPSIPAAIPVSQLISTPFAQSDIFVSDIDDQFQVLGYGKLGNARIPFAANLLNPNSTTLLDISGFSSGSAFAENGAGMAVGSVESTGLPQPVLWKTKPGAQKTLLPLLSGFVGGIANSIDRNGVVGGTVINALQSGGVAVIWSQGQVIDLNTISTGLNGCNLQAVLKISDSGFIQAYGLTAANSQCQVVLAQ